LITTWSSGSPEANMDDEILIGLREIVSHHPWWLARANLILALLNKVGIVPPANILEAGCGWGTNLELLETAGYEVTGLDISRNNLEQLDRADRNLVEADLSQPLPGGLPTYDCVLALDVIEHLDDDCQTVRELARLAKPGGRLLFSVPALPDLFSEFDEVQGHRRRYTSLSFRECLEEADLLIEDILWWGQWMVAPLRSRKTSRRGRPTDTRVEVY